MRYLPKKCEAFFQKNVFFCSQSYRAWKAPFGCVEAVFKAFHKYILGIFKKLCAFWALDVAPTLDVPTFPSCFYVSMFSRCLSISLIPFVNIIFFACWRKFVREKNDIEGNFVFDCCVTTFCCFCTILQVQRGPTVCLRIGMHRQKRPNHTVYNSIIKRALFIIRSGKLFIQLSCLVHCVLEKKKKIIIKNDKWFNRAMNWKLDLKMNEQSVCQFWQAVFFRP